MLNDFQSIDSLVLQIKATTRFLSRLLSRKSGLALLFIVCAVILSNLFLV